jgi:hypothetical protein
MNTKVYSNKELELSVRDQDDAIRVSWTGRSTARDPVAFIGPILSEALARSAADDKQLVLDFQALVYMNSSTITPVIRILHEVKKGKSRVLVLYKKAAKWQELSFSALTVFESDDARVEIRGV